MSQTAQKLARRGHLIMSTSHLPIAEAQPCAGACAWCPCGAHVFDWSARRGLRVNGGGAAMLLHLARAKEAWADFHVALDSPLPRCARVELGDVVVARKRAHGGAAAAPTEAATTGALSDASTWLVLNRPPRSVASMITYHRGVRVSLCDDDSAT